MQANRKIAIYIRVASADQISLDAQGERLRRFAIENGYDNAVVYADNGYSGLDFDRPAFAKLEADIKSGKIGAVIVRDVVRISRDCFAADEWIARLADSGVAVIVAEKPYHDSFLENLCFYKLMNGGRRP